jgi:hypothetical protein
MTTSHVRARSRQAAALLGAIAVLVAGCTAAGGGSGAPADRAGPARHSVAASPPGRAFHRIATTPRPGSGTHRSGPGIGRTSPLAPCAPPLGDPVTYRAGAASRLRVAVLACLCCRWCACAWTCCGCGPGRWPPRSHLAWQCCPYPLGPPGGDSSAIPPACGPGCGSFACPAGPRVWESLHSWPHRWLTRTGWVHRISFSSAAGRQAGFIRVGQLRLRDLAAAAVLGEHRRSY